jgi:transposase InsO family protein
MTDNAFAYTQSRAFRAVLADLGARHLTTRPYRPRTNGKAERFIQTALREWLHAKPYPSSAHRAADMLAWLHWYNHHRPHAGIHAAPGQQTEQPPWQRQLGRASRNTSTAARCAG